MKKINLKSLSSMLVIVVVSVLAVGSYLVTAYDGGEKVINIAGNYIESGDCASENVLGGEIYNKLVSFDEGIAVDGTIVIDGSGNFDGAVTGTSGTFSGTLGVTGATTLASTLTVAGATDVSKFTQGGSVLASTSMNTTVTFTQADMTTYSYWKLTPNVANTALTLPATSTLTTAIPNAGDSMVIYLSNESAVAATTTTIVAGAGMDLQEPDGQNVVIGGTSTAIITFLRDSTTDVLVFVDEFIVAD